MDIKQGQYYPSLNRNIEESFRKYYTQQLFKNIIKI